MAFVELLNVTDSTIIVLVVRLRFDRTIIFGSLTLCLGLVCHSHDTFDGLPRLYETLVVLWILTSENLLTLFLWVFLLFADSKDFLKVRVLE